MKKSRKVSIKEFWEKFLNESRKGSLKKARTIFLKKFRKKIQEKSLEFLMESREQREYSSKEHGQNLRWKKKQWNRERNKWRNPWCSLKFLIKSQKILLNESREESMEESWEAFMTKFQKNNPRKILEVPEGMPEKNHQGKPQQNQWRNPGKNLEKCHRHFWMKPRNQLRDPRWNSWMIL